MALQTEKENYKKEEIIRKEEYDSIKEKYISLIENKSKNNKLLKKNKNKILELEKEINKKNGKLLERQKEIDKNQEDIINFQNEVHQLKNDIKEQEEEIEKLNKKIIKQNETINEYKQKIDSEKEIFKKIENKNNKPSTLRNCYIRINTSRTKSAKKNSDKKKYVNDYHHNYNSESVINKNDKTSTIINTNLNESKNIEKNQIEEENNKIEENSHVNINNTNINTDISDLEFTPDNYTIIKCTEVTSKLRWYLFKRKTPKNNNSSTNNNNAFIFTHLKSYFKNSKSYRNTLNNYTSKNPELLDACYEDFIWKPFKNQKEFIKFGELPISETRESWNQIEELNGKIRKLEQKMIEKEKEYEVLYINYNILNQKNKNYEEQDKLIEMIDKLKKENSNLNNLIIKLKTEKHDDVGLSFIDNDLEASKFLDDKCFEDILTSLDKNNINEKKSEINVSNSNQKNNINNSKEKKNENKDKSNIQTNKGKESLFNVHLKDSINLLMNQAAMNQNAKSTLSSILIQLGCSDEDIYKLMGNYRGTISIAGSANYNLNKKY